MSFNPNNMPAMYQWQDFTPALIGATDNPVVTYSTQKGRFILLPSVCLFTLDLVTTTMTKATLTDELRIALPFAAATQTGEVWRGAGWVENGTAVANASQWEIPSAAAYLRFREMNIAAASALMTYAATGAGVGVLTNTINFHAAGFFEY